jgi:hypothetical protein
MNRGEDAGEKRYTSGRPPHEVEFSDPSTCFDENIRARISILYTGEDTFEAQHLRNFLTN